MDEIILESNKSEIETKMPRESFEFWQKTAQYALKQYNLALTWGMQAHNQEWIKNYNELWVQTAKMVQKDTLTQYTRAWQDMWENFSIVSFKAYSDYWKEFFASSKGVSDRYKETKEQLTEDWFRRWLTK